MTWKGYEKNNSLNWQKINQTKGEIKQEFKLKDRKIRESNNIVEVNSENENVENLAYQSYYLM